MIRQFFKTIYFNILSIDYTITVFFHCVTFSEKEEINDVIQQRLSRGNESYD